MDSMRIHKSTDINIRTLVKIAEMLKIVRDHLKTKTMCKHTFKILLRFVPDWYKSQQMSDKAILENDGTLKSVADD